MKTIEALEQTGYEIRTDGQEIKLTYHGHDKPDPSKVRPLILDLKEHKDEALVVLRERETSRIFRDAMHDVASRWIPGIMNHLEAHHGETWELIQQAEETLEQTWTRTLTASMTMKDFEEAVTTWRDVYRLAIEEHQTRGCEECEGGRDRGGGGHGPV